MAKRRNRCTTRLLAALASAWLIASSPAHSQSASGIPVDVPWSGSKPDRVELRGSATPVPIGFDASTNRFRGQYPRSRNVASSEDVIMVGRWQDRDDRVLFLRISPDLRAVNLQLLRQSYLECRKVYLDPLQPQARDREIALEAYFKARALYTLDNENQCRGARKEDAARAWFNKSFELAMTDCVFRLNPEATRAYRPYQPAYVADKEEAARLRGLACQAQARNRLWSRGELALAFAVGDRLVQELVDDPALQRAAARYSAIAEPAFTAEQAQLRSYLESTSSWQDPSTQYGGPEDAVVAAPGPPPPD